MQDKTDFEALIQKNYPDNSKLSLQLRKAWIVMSRHEDFLNLPIQSQFDFCVTICLIAVQSTYSDLKRMKFLGNQSKETFEYSIYEI